VDWRVEDTEYAHLTGRIRAKEARMLTAAQFHRLAEAGSPAELGRQLGETDYREVVEAAGDAAAAIDRVVTASYREVRALSPDGAPVDLVELGRRFAAAAAGFRSGEPVDGLPGELVEEIRERRARGEPPHLVDALLERRRFWLMAEAARRSGSAFLERLVEVWADLVNLQMTLRARLLGRRSAFLADKLVPGSQDPELFLRAVGEPWSELPRLYAGTPGEQVAARAAEEAMAEGALPSLGKLVDDALTARFRHRSDLDLAAQLERAIVHPPESFVVES
jgi:hypothetical protein